MSELDQLTATQLREAARILDDWIREERHRAEVEAELLDEDGALACREVADRVRAVQQALEAEAAHRDATDQQTNDAWDLVS
jgi:hypothetical protein